jgi:hypothetical protein
MYFFTFGRGVPVEKPLRMCYTLINAYIPDKYVLLLFFCFIKYACVQLLCENENANGNALWFVGVFL